MKAKAIALGTGIALGAGGTILLATSQHAQFMAGGGLINVGYGLQDHLDAYDLEHEHDITPAQVWERFLNQNENSASVRQRLPRTPRHPLIAILACMDGRIDTNELTGDSRKNYYVLRTAGSILEAPEQEMLELAVVNGVKVVVLTRHTDCAAEKTAANPEKRAGFPALSAAVDQRAEKVKEFLARPAIAERIAKGELIVKDVIIDTATDRILPEGAAPAPASAPEATLHTH